MSESHRSEGPADLSRTDVQAALFAQLVMQQTNMAMLLLGKVAHPETGEVIKDVEAARLFIDTLEMLEAKTRGNLSKEEANLLQQSLVGLRLNYVEAVEAPEAPAQPPPAPGKAPAGGPAPGAAPAPPEEEHHKKFSKKY